MLPDVWEQQTFGQNMEWLEGVWNKVKGERDQMLFAAWAYGFAAREAIVSAINKDAVYPTTYKELWRLDDDPDIVDGEVDERTKEEKENAAWMMERDLLIMRLQAAQEGGY